MLKNVFLITDLDGTALNTEKRFSDEDIAAIAELKAAGGVFAVATGRGYGMAKPVVEPLGLDIPAVLFNGAAVYDFKNEKFLWRSVMDKKVEDYIRDILCKFPELSAEILREQDVYVQQINEREQWHLKLGNVKPVMCGFDEIPRGDWIKALIVGEEQQIVAARSYIDENCSDNVNWVMSAPVFYEALPKGIDKSAGMKKLLELTGNEGRFTVAVGDYFNDAAMIKAAHLGVAVENAHEDVKAIADLVVGSNDENPIRQIIDYLKEM